MEISGEALLRKVEGALDEGDIVFLILGPNIVKIESAKSWTRVSVDDGPEIGRWTFLIEEKFEEK